MTDTPRETILADIRNRLAAFTLGPLDANDRGDGSGSLYRRDASDYEILDDPLCRPLRGAARLVDCQFFACAADDIRTLLAEYDTLRAQLAAREGEIATLRIQYEQAEAEALRHHGREDRLKEEALSWRRVSERLQGERLAAEARADTAEARLRAQEQALRHWRDYALGFVGRVTAETSRLMNKYALTSAAATQEAFHRYAVDYRPADVPLQAPPITKESQPHE